MEELPERNLHSEKQLLYLHLVLHPTDSTTLPNVTTQPPWTTKPGVSTGMPVPSSSFLQAVVSAGLEYLSWQAILKHTTDAGMPYGKLKRSWSAPKSPARSSGTVSCANLLLHLATLLFALFEVHGQGLEKL